MKKIVFLILLFFIGVSCNVQKYYSENGRRISKKIYYTVKQRKIDYVIENMSDEDKNILKSIKITKSVEDSLVNIYNNY